MTVRLRFAQSMACGDSLSRVRLCIDKVSAGGECEHAVTVRLRFAQSMACGDSLSGERLCIDKVSAM